MIAVYGRFSDLNALVWENSNIITYLKHYIFIKLSQIVYKDVKMKSICGFTYVQEEIGAKNRISLKISYVDPIRV